VVLKELFRPNYNITGICDVPISFQAVSLRLSFAIPVKDKTYMKVSEFESLTYESKLKATKQAVYIDSRQTDSHQVFLYQLNGFYIEVFYQNDYNFVSNIRGFDDLTLLEPYLQKIDIL
jgi:hypothetical protein